jgi:uncharacterized membrane protein
MSCQHMLYNDYVWGLKKTSELGQILFYGVLIYGLGMVKNGLQVSVWAFLAVTRLCAPDFFPRMN